MQQIFFIIIVGCLALYFYNENLNQKKVNDEQRRKNIEHQKQIELRNQQCIIVTFTKQRIINGM